MSLFDNPLNDAPIRREFCLHTKWFDDDPMPHVCALGYGHDGNHGTRPFGGPAGYVGVTHWPNEDDEKEVA